MPNYFEVAEEIKRSEHKAANDHVRRKYLKMLYEHTKRPTIIYAMGVPQGRPAPPGEPSIRVEDMQLFMSAIHGLKGSSLDLILHTQGGSGEATEQLVCYLRQKFTDLRAIVPLYAMSAGTMLACAANCILMGRQSALGPIDPQISMVRGNSISLVPAQALLDEFAEAQRAVNDPRNNPLLWVQKIQDYHPGLLDQCTKAVRRSKQVVAQWLERYMFVGRPEGQAKAKEIAEWLGSNVVHLSHGKPIDFPELKAKGFAVGLLEDDNKLQDLVLSVFHATMYTFAQTPCFKLVENHEGKGMYLLANLKTLQ
jgi:hypothetical protein